MLRGRPVFIQNNSTRKAKKKKKSPTQLTHTASQKIKKRKTPLPGIEPGSPA
jgi:hypothetical protein